MNKKILIYAIALSAVLLMGCGMRDTNNGTTQSEVKESSPDSSLPNQSAKPSQTDAGQNSIGNLMTNDSVGNNDSISETEAKNIALGHSGLKENEVMFEKVELETDEKNKYYDVEFKSQNGIEYDYEIDFYTGEIIEYDYDMEDVINHNDDGTNASTDQKQLTEGASKAR